MSVSCAYEGWVRHRRHAPVSHELRMRLFMLYLDLDELPSLFDDWRLASARGRSVAEFRRSDHLGDPRISLASEIRALVGAQSGKAPVGPIRLLTNLRYLGHAFNPVSFYYCFDTAGEHVEAVVAEVTNTPWGECHAYVLEPDPARSRSDSIIRGSFQKEFHVSPFMGLDHVYDWRMTRPGEQLIVHIDSHREEALAFDATLSLARRELTAASLDRLLVRYPLLTVRILGRIYGHGARVWAKGASYFPNPSGAPPFGPARRKRARASREAAGHAEAGRPRAAQPLP